MPVAIAAPLVGVELWFDMRSRSRRLVPSLRCDGHRRDGRRRALVATPPQASRPHCGSCSPRSIAAIPFVRTQVLRLRHDGASSWTSDAAQVAGLTVALGAIAVLTRPSRTRRGGGRRLLAVAQFVWSRRPPVPAKTLGLRQLFLGLAVVGITATGVLAL